MPLPRTGTPAAEILAQLDAIKVKDVDWKSLIVHRNRTLRKDSPGPMRRDG